MPDLHGLPASGSTVHVRTRDGAFERLTDATVWRFHDEYGPPSHVSGLDRGGAATTIPWHAVSTLKEFSRDEDL